MQNSPSRLSYEQIKGITEQFLEKYHPNYTIPIPIEEIVELKLKIKISTIPNLKSECDTDGFISSDFTEITLDDNMFNLYEERARFTIAHEVGHKILHAKIYENCKIKTKEEYREFQNSLTDENQKWLEVQAHIFAACVLVPTKKLKEEMSAAMGGQNPQADYSISYLRNLPQRFKVSWEVLARRIVKERLLKE